MDDSEKNILNESEKASDKPKTEMGTANIETPIIFDDFDSEEFDNYCRAYIDHYHDEITEFANEIYFLNENPKARIKHARILFSLLHVGFSTYLQARREKEKAGK